MRDFKNKVAVITGAASGIGLALAQRAAAEGMKVVLADVERNALAAAAEGLRQRGAETLAVVTDVRDDAQVEALRDRSLAAFGAVHLLCNNAGVGATGFSWEMTVDDWEWVVGVNFWGVVHGIRAFVPGMIAGGEEAHVVNTASVAGLVVAPGMSAYNATKHAVVALSETLYHELVLTGTRVRASVLCPAWVKTRILDSGRNRPTDLPETTDVSERPEFAAVEAAARAAMEKAVPPEGIAAKVFEAVRGEQFWIFTHPNFARLVRERFDAAVEQRTPPFRLPGQ